MKRKKLRRRAEKLSYLVEIAEQEARLAELQKAEKPAMGFTGPPQGAHGITIDHPAMEEGEMTMAFINGGKPSKGTPKDKRLKENKPKPPVMPVKKGGK